MKILITNGHLHIGGVEKSLIDLLKSIDYTKHHVDLLLFEDYGDYLAEVPGEVNIILFDLTDTYGSLKNVFFQLLRNRNFRSLLQKCILALGNKIDRRFLALFRLFKIVQSKYDCAIAYRIGFSADYVSFCVSAPRKYMWWHNGEFDYDEETVVSWNKTLKGIDKIVCVSDSVKEMIKPYFPIHRERMLTIPNMIRRDEIYQKGKLFSPYKESETKGRYILTTVGRMSPEKMMINVVYALDILSKKGYKNILWYVVGDGVERKKIEQEITRLQLENYIVLEGNKENPYPFLVGADLYVHPSYVESQGLTILEAMTLNVPCVVTKSRGPNEFITDGVNGLLAEKSPEALAYGIERIITDVRLYSRIKENTHCPERFLQNNIMNRIEKEIFLKY